MPAKITVQSGISAGTFHWIEQRVARIGSDPQSEICLPSANIPAHALTLEFRDDTCRVYNRCQNNVYVGTQVIAPDEVATWPETDILQLGDDSELLLDFADEVPKSSNEFEFAEEAIGDETAGSEFEQATDLANENSKQSGGIKTVMQLAVTIACLAACAAMMLVKPSEGSTSTNNQLDFETVIDNARQSSTTSKELIQRLQFAEAAVVRNDNDAATDRFARLRDDLAIQRDRFTTEQREPELAILNFVEQRLNELQ